MCSTQPWAPVEALHQSSHTLFYSISTSSAFFLHVLKIEMMNMSMSKYYIQILKQLHTHAVICVTGHL